ncbi:TPA: hypothetical protein JG930_004370 [Enterobacter hormaechei subsp. steigerwaltii]|nr:hypothetical protein [Enterobacter hormaechei subsp. steigerwaltii]
MASNALRESEQHDDAHSRWLAAEIQATIDDTRPSLSHEEVMAELDAEIAALKARSAPETTAKAP